MIRERHLPPAIVPGTFVHTYLRFAARATDAPLVYSIGAAYALLSSVAPAELFVQFGGPVTASLWVVLVGEQSESRKSTVVGHVGEILQEVEPERLGNKPGSVEALDDILEEAGGRTTLLYEELGDLLKATERGYLSGLRERFTGLWSGQPHRKQLRPKDGQNRAVVIPNPRLTLVGGVTEEYLSQSLNERDFLGGFTSRWTYLLSEKEREYDAPSPGDRLPVIKALRIIATRPVGVCRGIDPAALATWSAWRLNTKERIRVGASPWAVGAVDRAQTVALKAAMLLTWSQGEAGGPKRAPWTIPEWALKAGIALANFHLYSTIRIIDGLATTIYSRERITVLRAIRGKGASARGRTLGEVLARCNPKLPIRRVREVLETLAEEGAITNTSTPGGDVFYQEKKT